MSNIDQESEIRHRNQANGTIYEEFDPGVDIYNGINYYGNDTGVGDVLYGGLARENASFLLFFYVIVGMWYYGLTI